MKIEKLEENTLILNCFTISIKYLLNSTLQQFTICLNFNIFNKIMTNKKRKLTHKISHKDYPRSQSLFMEQKKKKKSKFCRLGDFSHSHSEEPFYLLRLLSLLRSFIHFVWFFVCILLCLRERDTIKKIQVDNTKKSSILFNIRSKFFFLFFFCGLGKRRDQ